MWEQQVTSLTRWKDAYFSQIIIWLLVCFFKENGSIHQHPEKGQVICIYFLFDGSFKFKLDVLVFVTQPSIDFQ